MSNPEKRMAPDPASSNATQHEAHSEEKVIDADVYVNPNALESLRFLKWFRPEGPWTLTSIVPDGRISTQTFRADQDEMVAKWIVANNQTMNIYFQVNSCGDALVTKKAKKEHIRMAEWLHVDVDPEADVSLMDAERKNILGQIEDYSPPPNLIIDSGGGYQAFWRLSKKIETAEPKDWDEIESRNRQITNDFSGDHCWNIDRIMRVPGTVNHPNKKKLAKGRQKTISRIVRMEDRTFDLDVFPEAPTVEGGVRGDAARVSVVLSGNMEPILVEDLDQFGITDWIKMLIVQGEDPDNPGRWPSRSEMFWHVICSLVRSKVPDDTIASIMLDEGFGISGHVLDQSNPPSYIIRQLAKAHSQPTGLEYELDKDERPRLNVENLRRILAQMERRIWFDEHSLVEYLDNDPINDRTERNLRIRHVEEDFGLIYTKEKFHEFVKQIAFENRKHPLRQKLESLRWDGDPRIDTFLIDYAGAEHSDYVIAVSSLFFRAAVLRVVSPGIKFDELVILEGLQGGLKSTALEKLAFGPRWFTDALPMNGDSKLAIEQTAGKWICEVADMQGRTKDDDKLKAFLSRTHDRARLSYGRHAEEVPRSWIPIGTTNNSNYLSDATGHRRFWPVRVKSFDLNFDPEQLWAEAVARKDESIRMPRELWDAANAEQRAREVEDPWADLIQEEIGDKDAMIVCGDVYPFLGVRDGEKQKQAASVGKSMKRLGFSRQKNVWLGNKNQNVWTRGAEPILVRLPIPHRQFGDMEHCPI